MHPIAVASYVGGMVSRRASLGLVALLVVGLTGCTGAPAPDPSDSPSPAATGFASEEEAFAAAEETFAQYIAATNAIDLSNPESFEPLLTITTGDENATQRENLSQMNAAGWTVSGETTFSDFESRSFDPATQSVLAGVCIDVSAVDVVDVAGKSVVSESRADQQQVEVRFEPATTSTGLAVALSDRQGEGCSG